MIIMENMEHKKNVKKKIKVSRILTSRDNGTEKLRHKYILRYINNIYFYVSVKPSAKSSSWV